MKVGNVPSPSLPPSPSTTTSASSSASDSAPVADKSSSSVAATVDNVKATISDGRAVQVQQLADQVKSGAYQPNAQQIADEILQEAEVDAQLEASGG